MSGSTTYKKLVITQFSNDIRKAGAVVEESLRPPAAGEILVKNHYSGVNATDMNIIMGRSALAIGGGGLPLNIGLEGLGVIEAIGEGVDQKKFTIGQPGLVLAKTPKAYAEYIYAKADEFYPVPELKPQYLALLDCGLTATIGLDKSANIKSGEVVLITAAAGGTGHIGVQWAKRKGCQVIGLCSTPAKAAFLRSIGCDRVINYREEVLDTVLTEEYPNGIDVIWETIGGAVFETLFSHLALGGRLVIVGAISGYKTVGFPPIQIDNLATKLMNKCASLIGFRFRHFERHFAEYLGELVELYRSEQLTVQIDIGSSGVPFTGVAAVVDAVEHQQSGKNTGKVVVHIQQ